MKIKLTKIKKNNVSQKWIAWLNDKEVTRFSKNRFKKHTLKSQKKFLSQKLKTKDSILFKIFYNASHIGIIEIGKINKIKNDCYISYFIGEKKYWNKGIGTKVISEIKKIIYTNLKINRIYAGTYSNNIGSISILKKNKFTLFKKIPNFYKYRSRKVGKTVLLCTKL